MHFTLNEIDIDLDSDTLYNPYHVNNIVALGPLRRYLLYTSGCDSRFIARPPEILATGGAYVELAIAVDLVSASFLSGRTNTVVKK